MLLDQLAWVVAGGMFLLVTNQVIAGVCFLVRLHRGSRPTVSGFHPQAAVVLSLRGPDTFLKQTFSALLNQDYPGYAIFVIVDHVNDPVLEQIREISNQAPPGILHTRVLENRYVTCSLKCSALIEAIQRLDEAYEVVAFIDGDAPPHPRWLRDLVAPLEDRSIGVTTGNRWYLPADRRWGSLVRYFWNAGAAVLMWMNHLVWAGSMALRRDFATESGLLESWRQALSVDATLTDHVKQQGKKIRFVPAVMMINEEGISLKTFLCWVRRQLVTARTYGLGWIVIAVHAFSMSVLQLAAVVLLGRAAGSNNLTMGMMLAVAIAAYWITALLLVVSMDWSVRRTARANLTSKSRPSWPIVLRFLPALALTHILYPYALITACFRRSVTWRGIEYQIQNVNKIRMKDYRPFSHDDPS